MVIIGIDCATKEANTGLALGSVEDERISIIEITTGSKGRTSVDIISNWLSNNQPALLAFDAPLGWPIDLSKHLVNHVAGQLLRLDAELLFSRETDRVVHNTLKKKPFEVGANYIARTAHSALKLLNDLQQKNGQQIPLAWETDEIKGTSAIEVYPAATLKARRLKGPSKKDKRAENKRSDLLMHLDIGIASKNNRDKIIGNSDAFDAVICVLAASDFLLGKCISIPGDKIERVRKEGWIWVKSPEC